LVGGQLRTSESHGNRGAKPQRGMACKDVGALALALIVTQLGANKWHHSIRRTRVTLLSRTVSLHFETRSFPCLPGAD